MTNATIRRRLSQLEAQQPAVKGIHVMIPDGWMPADEYDQWHAAELAKAPPGFQCIAVRFVQHDEVRSGAVH